MYSEETFFITNATHKDYDAIQNLFQSGNIQYFGVRRRKARSADIFFSPYITHRLLVHESAIKRSILGYAEVTNSPGIPALPEDNWMDWLHVHYCCNLPVSVTNTCFFNTFFYNKDHNPELIRQVLCEIFYRENKLRFIITPQYPCYVRGYPERENSDYYCLEPFAKVFYPKCFSVTSCPNAPKLHVVFRDSMIPKMRYRRALPEDNDDIVEIINVDHPDLKQQLGDYYIAEELLSDSKSLLIVTEISHITAGFIWLNDNVNVLRLLENYDLKQYGNLVKCNPKERFKEKHLYITTAQRRPLEKLFTTEMVNKIYQSIDFQNLEKFSNLSVCSNNIESNRGHITSVNEKIFVRDFFLNKLKKLIEKLKTYDYYIQLHKRNFELIYNILDGETHAPFEVKSNAFVIQLFGLMGSQDTRRIFRFLLTSFAAFPDKDYCLLSVCVDSPMTSSLFEMLKYFIRVNPRPNCRINEDLFITQRSAIYGDISLFPVRQEDVADIKEILSEEIPQPYPTPKLVARSCIARNSIQSILSNYSVSYNDMDGTIKDDWEKVMAILNNIFEDPFTEYKCFTIRCGDSTRPIEDNTVVGFAIIRPFPCTELLNKHYYMSKGDELKTLMMAEVVALKLHPLFHCQADIVFRELARQSNYWHFYHFRPTNRHCLSNDLLTNMQPLEPRRRKKIWFCNFDQSSSMQPHSSVRINLNKSTEYDAYKETRIDILHDRFAAFENNLLPTEFFGCSKNIVILGFTDICKAFLRLMIFSWHRTGQKIPPSANCLPRINITVICSPGTVEAEYEHSFKCNTCSKEEDCWVNFRNSDAFIRDVCERMDVRTWIRFVSGKILSINTENQVIKLESECVVYYETLLLMCATEFGVPENIFGKASTPPNYTHINNRLDKLLFYHKLNILKNDFPEHLKKSIVIYGSHIRAFEFINFLLKHGMKGCEIHLVMPHTIAQVQVALLLNNSTEDLRIEEIVREMVEDLGVTVYERMNLRKYSLHDDGENLKEVTFLSFIGDREVTLQCDLFVSFYEMFIAGPVLEILDKASLDINQDFVIVNQNYQTSAPNIYAIGNFIKHKIEPNYQYHFVSPQEAAEKIINVLGLISSEESLPPLDKKFSKPFYFQAQLPMDYYFVKVTSAKRYLANHLDNEYGFPLVTYNEGDFTRVRLNVHGMVEEIVVVTRKKLDFDFLKFFCGHHELLLNNLRSRWYLKDIVSFIDFFQEPWVELLMHDNFEVLRMVNKTLIKPAAQEIMKKNIDRESKQKLMHNYCQDLGVTSQLEYALLEFIREHRSNFFTEIALPEDFPNPYMQQDL